MINLKIALIILIVFGFVYGDAYSKNITYGDFLSTQSELPNFESYKTEILPFTPAKELKISKKESGWIYRNTLRKAFNEDANFSGHYIISSIGCGSPCQINFILDKATGRVVDSFESSVGVLFNKDSNLIIVNPSEGYEDTLLDEFPLWLEMSFYELSNNKLRLIKELKIDSTKKSEE